MDTADDIADREAVLAIFEQGLRQAGFPALLARGGARWIYARVEAHYRRAGSPYGPGHQALMRWVTKTPITPTA